MFSTEINSFIEIFPYCEDDLTKPSVTCIPVVALLILIMSSVLGVKQGLSSLDIWVRKYRAESGNLNSVRLSRVERNLNKKTLQFPL